MNKVTFSNQRVESKLEAGDKLVKRIIIGTAQFGMDYGINNRRGRIPMEEAFQILGEAAAIGIDIVDTASTYGDTESVLGTYRKRYSKELRIISKLKECKEDQIDDTILTSFKKTNSNKLYGYLIHNFSQYRKNPVIWEKLEKFKSDGKIEKIGFSLYYPEELNCIMENKLKVDILQIPFNIFDQRFLPYLAIAKNLGVEINVRSVFLQGLVFADPATLGVKFAGIKDRLNLLRSLSTEKKIPLAALCLGFAVLNPHIDKIVIGLDSIDHFREIVTSLQYINTSKKTILGLASFSETNEMLIVPLNWHNNYEEADE